VFAFIDESYQKSGEGTAYYTTYAAIMLAQSASRGFSRELFNLKKGSWPEKGVSVPELKGRVLLSERKLRRPDYRAFVDSILELIEKYRVVPFAVVSKGPMRPLKSSRMYFPRQLQFLLERVNNYTALVSQDDLAVPVIDNVEDKTNRTISEAMSNFLFRSAFGQTFWHISDFPTFGDSATTPGIQIADLVAYCVNAYYSGRADLDAMFQRLRRMTYNWSCGGQVTDWGFRYLDESDRQDTS
jgi:hypothetical protein